MSLKNLVFVFFFYCVNYCLAGGLVVEGELAPNGSFKHCASYALDCLRDREWLSWACTGSVLTQRVILSAAHCLEPCREVKALIKVGHVDTTKAQSIPYSHHISHEEFMNKPIKNDITLIFLTSDIIFGNDVKRVALMKHPPDGKAYVAGWGRRYDDQPISEIHLRYAKQTVIDSETCNRTVQNLREGTICAMTNENEKGRSAMGDSGAALIVKRFIQIGIVSYRTERPSTVVTMYSYIPYYLEWIENNVNNLYCEE